MDRNKLTAQVKDEYTRLSSAETRAHVTPSTNEQSPGAYYENLLGQVEREISAGRFDGFGSGTEIVEAVANDKPKWLPHWKEEESAHAASTDQPQA